MTENSEFGRKPLPLQRILSENVQSSSRLKSQLKPELKCHGKEKENSKDSLEETIPLSKLAKDVWLNELC